MTWMLHQIILGLHIILAIIWVGGLLFIGWGVFPAIRHLKFVDQRQFLLALMKWSHWLFSLAGFGVILTGVILGTALGPIHHWEDIWNSLYGNLWITALIVASFSLTWGIFVGYKSFLKILTDENLWILADRNMKEPLYQALVILFLVESVEPVGFGVLLILMVLL
ncbi:hypothetical protein ACNQFZ_10065 [Schinkia sp. CFF1]